MQTLEGSHGTSESNARKIEHQGFLLGEGKAGRGAYFWLKSFYYIELAKGWYAYCCYRCAEKKGKCAVIIAELSCEDNELIDLESTQYKDVIAQLASARSVNQNNNRQVAALHEAVISRMEKKLGVKFRIVIVRVAPPQLAFCPEYPIKILGGPVCCVARDTDCITIKEIRIL